jgi:LysR family cys regulon transcriptional activator
MAELAYDAARDKGLVAMPAGSLFGINRVKLAVRRDAFLRGYALSFIELFAPQADSRTLERLMKGPKKSG